MRHILALITVLFSQLALAGTIVNVETNKGNFQIELNDEKAPISTENFLKYVDSGFYDGTIFHRSVKNFVVQGGGLTPDMQEKSTLDPIPSEAKNGLSNLKGTIGMARTEDINSATSQFYINTKDNLGLDYSEKRPGYAVFGKVISGYEVIEAIENAQVHDVGEYQHVPVEAVVIISMKRQADMYYISMKAYRDDRLRSERRIVTLLDTEASVTQSLREFYTTSGAIIKTALEDQIEIEFKVDEKLEHAVFKFTEFFLINKNGGFKEINYPVNGVNYRYQVNIEKLVTLNK